MDLDYIRMMRKCTRLPGFWPAEGLGEKVPLFVKWHKIQIFLQNVIGFVGQVTYIVVFFDHIPFLEVGELYITASLTFMIIARCSLPNFKKYQHILSKFLTEFHLVNHKHSSGYDSVVFGEMNKISYYCTVYHISTILIVPIAFNVLPIYNSYKAGAFRGLNLEGIDLELSIYFHYPGFNCLDYFYLLTFTNIYFTFIGGASIILIDGFLAIIVFQIIGHIRILIHNMENLPRPKQESVVQVPGAIKYNVKVSWYDDDENKYINNVLVDMIEHHKYIIRYVREISSFFGPVLGLNYFFHSVNLCVLMVECIRCEQDAIVRNLCLLGSSLGNLLVTSIIFEIVSTHSEKLIDAVYTMPWESMNVSNRKHFMLFLSRVQDPIRVTSMGVVDVGVRTMGAIIRTSLSYCTFLLQLE